MKNYNYEGLSNEDRKLLELIHQSNITIKDIRWLRNKKRFKRYIRKYSEELKSKINPTIEEPTKKEVQKQIEKEEPKIKLVKEEPITKEDVEILDFTKTISLPSQEVLEMFDFAKSLEVSNVEDVQIIAEKVKKKLRKEQLVWSIILIACIFLFSAVGVYLISWQYENNRTKNLVAQVQNAARIPRKTQKVKTTKQGDDIEAPELDSSINFEELEKMNEQTKGWINVKGTNIDYPFVQTTNNQFYLDHSFDKSYNKKGWVFLDYRNDINNLSRNTILYAHGLLNKVMFGTLKKVVTEEWYLDKANRRILITTPNGYYLWEVFSTYTIEPESYYIMTRFKNDNAFRKFIGNIKSRSVYDYDVKVTAKDKILTLSSCYDHSKRVVLHAKLIKQG